jgi:hypothetical protein
MLHLYTRMIFEACTQCVVYCREYECWREIEFPCGYCVAILVCMICGGNDPCWDFPCRAHDMLWVRYVPSLVGLGPEMVAACLHE